MAKANFEETQFSGNPAGAKAIAIIFVIGILCHGIIFVWRKSWYFLWFIIGLILEIVGYIQISNGTIQSVCIIIAPLFLAATFYMSMNKVLKAYGTQDLNPIKAFSVIFVIGDFVSLGLQIAGIVIQFVVNLQTGRIMVIISFVIQILLFISFFTTTIIVHKRMNYEKIENYPDTNRYWRGYFYTMYVVSIMFMIRNLFRLVEYAEGFGYIFFHVIFTLVFDGIPMLVVTMALLICHPSFYSIKRSIFHKQRDKQSELLSKQLKQDRETKIKARYTSGTDRVTRNVFNSDHESV
ncbi:putative membrane protein [Wickerhamomyces ciferrii]|uniref:Membrane protein n=1 Tax=Wickerhamomyces ciferrii (strain ATCC 14091 / BCRC 22168 / CBS 111 / JCM 3599 / NBRC 0793 / NRRL Y-1031 F-60-10) TaxID=1206466 RepID=K0KTN6_WICCF|nr:uncharacterized protein BN7_4197 [Wickerhamomyces ciferrii]CCH44628.1 putative membrane protein [Wickerhamomyces ciferrii]